MGGVADIRGARDPLGQPADGQDPAAGGELLEERERGSDLGRRRAAVRARRARMSGDDVPAERVQLELRQCPLDDRRGRLGRTAARELALGRERDPRDARPAEPCRLSDEQQGRVGTVLQVTAKPLAAKVGPTAPAVEVVRRSDPRRSQPVHELPRVHAVTMLMRVRGRVGALVALCFGVSVAPAHAAAPPQGYQPDAAFASSYAARGVTSVAATTQRVSCYAPEVLRLLGLAPGQGFPQGGGTPCSGATTGENIGPYPTQDLKGPAVPVKDH